MSETKRLYCDVEENGEIGEGFEQYNEDMEHNYEHETTEELICLGLKHAGYNGARINEQTTLLRITRAVVIFGFVVGLMWALPGLYLNIRPLAAGGGVIFLIGAFSLTIHSWLEHREPQVSARLSKWLREQIHPSAAFADESVLTKEEGE